MCSCFHWAGIGRRVVKRSGPPWWTSRESERHRKKPESGCVPLRLGRRNADRRIEIKRERWASRCCRCYSDDDGVLVTDTQGLLSFAHSHAFDVPPRAEEENKTGSAASAPPRIRLRRNCARLDTRCGRGRSASILGLGYVA